MAAYRAPCGPHAVLLAASAGATTAWPGQTHDSSLLIGHHFFSYRWKSPDNAFRKAFGLKAVPSIIRVESSAQDSLADHVRTPL